MVLTKEELVSRLQQEVRILLHLISKADAGMLDYRPTAKQRSLLELMRYLITFAPIHLRTIRAGVLDMAAWIEAWQTGEAEAAKKGLREVKEELERQAEWVGEQVRSFGDDELRTPMEMFGNKASKGSLLVQMLLCHYTAYRMQLFLYLKACGREELGTINLWAGADALPKRA